MASYGIYIQYMWDHLGGTWRSYIWIGDGIYPPWINRSEIQQNYRAKLRLNGKIIEPNGGCLGVSCCKIWHKFWVKHATFLHQTTHQNEVNLRVGCLPIVWCTWATHNPTWQRKKKKTQFGMGKSSMEAPACKFQGKSLFTICSALSWWRGSTLWKFCIFCFGNRGGFLALSSQHGNEIYCVRTIQ